MVTRQSGDASRVKIPWAVKVLMRTATSKWIADYLKLVSFIRETAETCLHQTCSAKMGRGSMSVVDGNLKVYGVDKVRIADKHHGSKQ